jgi:hypothetical protein
VHSSRSHEIDIAAVGGWSTGAVGLMLRVSLSDSPSSSVTVRVMVRGPPEA